MDIDETIVHVLQHSDVGQLRQYRRIPSGYVSDHWWVETTAGQYFLKCRHASRGKPLEVEAQHALLASSIPVSARNFKRSRSSCLQASTICKESACWRFRLLG